MWPADINQVLDGLQADLDRARVAVPIAEEIIDRGQWDPRLDADFGLGKCVVYVFESTGKDETARIVDDFRRFRDARQGGDRHDCALPRLNGGAGRMLYVGSCINGAETRIAQHVGTAPKGTSALRLKHWFGDRPFRVHLRSYAVDRNVLQILEDCIAANLRPIFGKRGGNGR